MRLPQDRILHIDTEFKNGKVNIISEWQGELVRCKNCKFSDEDYPLKFFPNRTEEQARQYSCLHSTYSHDADFFCAYGKCRANMRGENK